MTPLDKTLKRSITINGQSYVITVSPAGLKISHKGHRLGIELNWADLISGETALAVALHASIGRLEIPQSKKPPSAHSRHPQRRAAKHGGRASAAKAPTNRGKQKLR